MASLVVTDFKAGLDARNMPESTLPGALLIADNCVINQGGEVEKHEAWNQIFKLPDNNTFGLRVVDDISYVFGSLLNPGAMPQKVVYVRLVPASGANMTEIIHTELFNGLIYVIALYDDGHIVHFYDEVEVVGLPDQTAVAKMTLATGTGGQVEGVTVDSVRILAGNVPFNTDLTTTARDVADAINLTASIPNYRATSFGTTVIISAKKPGTAANGRTLRATYTNIIISIPSPLFAGGAPHVAGTFQPGTYAQTAETKMNTLSGSILQFSHINDPIDVDPDPIPTPIGEGFINLSNHASGSESLKAMTEYFDDYAIFGFDTVQIWSLDPDPALNNRKQTLKNVGTVAPLSVVSFGTDTAFLDRTGIRSLRGRDSSRSANVNDIGTAIDPIIQDLIINDRLNTRRAVGTVDPLTGRYYLAIGEEIYIFNYFPGNKVSGWTKSLPGFRVEVFDQRELRIVARAGDRVFQLGGGISPDGFCPATRYGTEGLPDGTGLGFNSQACVMTPFLDAGDPSRFKNGLGIDLAIEGQWDVFILENPKDFSQARRVGKIENSTFREDRIPTSGHSTHFALKFVSIGHEFSKISKILRHFESAEQE